MKKQQKKNVPESTPLLRFLFVVYAAVLLWLLFDRSVSWDPEYSYAELLRNNMNLIPFRTIGNYWKVVLRWKFTPLFFHCVINLVGNVLLFIPIGYFMPRLWPGMRHFGMFLLTCVLSVMLVELLQLVTLRGCLDVDDLILNLYGMLIGYVIYAILKNRRKRGKK